MKNLEKVLKALANRRRLAILRYLKKSKEATVGDIANEINLSIKATSKHLSILFGVDILDKEQRSILVFYRLSATTPNVARNIISIL